MRHVTFYEWNEYVNLIKFCIYIRNILHIYNILKKDVWSEHPMQQCTYVI